jgi:hypothetical protein
MGASPSPMLRGGDERDVLVTGEAEADEPLPIHGSRHLFQGSDAAGVPSRVHSAASNSFVTFSAMRSSSSLAWLFSTSSSSSSSSNRLAKSQSSPIFFRAMTVAGEFRGCGNQKTSKSQPGLSVPFLFEREGVLDGGCA